MGVIDWVERAASKKAAHHQKRKGKPAVKIPVEHIDLGKLGYDGYWIEMPKSIKEGVLHELSATRPAADEDENQSAAARDANIKILSLVSAWNIDDDEGKVFPVLSKVKARKDQEAIVAELPVDIIMHVAQRITGSIQIPEKTKDF